MITLNESLMNMVRRGLVSGEKAIERSARRGEIIRMLGIPVGNEEG